MDITGFGWSSNFINSKMQFLDQKAHIQIQTETVYLYFGKRRYWEPTWILLKLFNKMGTARVSQTGFSAPLGVHEQRPSLGSFAVILNNPSVTIY